MPSIRDANSGERPSAQHLNEIRDAACREFTGAVAGSDSHGVTLPIFSSESLELYELTGEPELDDTSREYKATAKPCIPMIVAVDVDGHYTGVGEDGNRQVRYRMRATARDETLWFPAGDRDADAEPSAAPGGTTGTRVWTVQSYGRRVVVNSAGATLTPFELYDDIEPGGTSGTAIEAWVLDPDTLVRDETADKIEVADGIIGDVRALGTVTTSGDGSRGWYSVAADGSKQIVSIQRLARTIVVANTYSGHAAVAADDTSFSAAFTRVCDDGQAPAEAAAEIVIYNPVSGFEIDDNLANILCVLDTGTGVSDCLYRVVDAACPA